MRKFNYISKDFKESEISKYKLALQLGKFEYGYTIYNVKLKKFVSVKFDLIPENLKSYSDKLSFVFEKETLLKKEFNSVAFIFASTKATLIPKKIFSEETKTELLSYNHFLSSNEIALSNKIQNTDIVNVFAFPEELKTVLAKNLKNYQIYHQYTSFVESSIVANLKKITAKEVYINVDNDFFNICVVQNKKLLFNNSFNYRSIEDFIYFITLALKNLNLSKSDTPIILSGNISEKVGTFKILKKYFKAVKFKVNFPKAAFSEGLKLDKHYFDNLIYMTV